jgi:hypothetical protein
LPCKEKDLHQVARLSQLRRFTPLVGVPRRESPGANPTALQETQTQTRNTVRGGTRSSN